MNEEAFNKNLMPLCDNCGTSDNVCHDSGFGLETVYYCAGCEEYFIFIERMICDKCGSPFGLEGGCSNIECDSTEYHINVVREELDKGINEELITADQLPF